MKRMFGVTAFSSIPVAFPTYANPAPAQN